MSVLWQKKRRFYDSWRSFMYRFIVNDQYKNHYPKSQEIYSFGISFYSYIYSIFKQIILCLVFNRGRLEKQVGCTQIHIRCFLIELCKIQGSYLQYPLHVKAVILFKLTCFARHGLKFRGIAHAKHIKTQLQYTCQKCITTNRMFDYV